jgi:hypothetical protein
MKYDDFILEQYLLGELSESESLEWQKRISNDSELQKRVALLEKNNSDIREQFPLEIIEGKIRQDRALVSESTKSNNWQGFNSLINSFSLLVLLVLGITVTYNTTNTISEKSLNSPGEIVRIKGLDAQLNVYKKTRLGSSLMKDSMVVDAGDEFQLEYVVTEKCYGVIFSIDGNGVVTFHLGSVDGGAVAFAELKQLLPFSYQLDDAPGHETFYMVMSSEVFDASMVVDMQSGEFMGESLNHDLLSVEKVVLLKGSN